MAGYQRFAVPRGTTWQTTLEVADDAGDPVELDGATVVMHIRSTAAATGDPLLELSTTNGRITIVDPGTLVLGLTAGETAALSWSHGVYDVRMTLAGQVTVLLRGEITVDPTVTH